MSAGCGCHGDFRLSPSSLNFSAPTGVAWMIQQKFENAKFTGELWVEQMASDHLNKIGHKSQYEPGTEQIKLWLE